MACDVENKKIGIYVLIDDCHIIGVGEYNKICNEKLLIKMGIGVVLEDEWFYFNKQNIKISKKLLH